MLVKPGGALFKRVLGIVTFLPLYFTFCALDKGAGKPHNKY